MCAAGIVRAGGHRRAIMPFRVSGKNIDVGEALRERVNARVADAVAKYFDGDFPGTSPSPGRGSGSAPSAWVISTPASCSEPKRSRPMPMQAPIKQPSVSKRGCAVTSAGARIVNADGRALGRDARERAAIDAPSPVVTGRARRAEGNDAEPSRYGWTVTLDTAASIWFTAARMVTSAGSIHRNPN